MEKQSLSEFIKSEKYQPYNKKAMTAIETWFPDKFWDRIVIILMTILSYLAKLKATVLGYFMPIQGVAHALFFLFCADILFGWLQDRKKNGAKFKVSKIWDKTVPRMAVVTVMLVGAFMIDNETGQKWVETTDFVTFFFGWLLIHSIWKNGVELTGWKGLELFGKVLKRKFNYKTGLDIKDEDIN